MTASYFFSQYKVYWVLFILAVASWFLVDVYEKKPSKTSVIAAHSPDYFSSGYQKHEMGVNGRVINELIADKLIHYSDDGTTHLENPVMSLYYEDQPPWVISSETAVLQADKDNLNLDGQVHISKDNLNNLSPFEINTTYLKVKLSTSFAETDQWAEIIDGSKRTQGVGMNFTFVEPIFVEFLSRVKGRYEVK